jgi:hypothetical protein
VLSIDLMDLSGEHQNDIDHDVLKSRLDESGRVIESHGNKLKGDLEQVAAVRGKDYCGSCFGGNPPESGCCNTCDEVREAYVRKGWSFTNPDGIDQCVEEHWSEKIDAQNKEGCNVAGRVRVNKVVGNFHMSPGRSFQSNSMHVHDLVPYLRSGNHHDFGHVIHRFSFGADGDPLTPTPEMVNVKRKLDIVDPLEGVRGHTEESNYMFQCVSSFAAGLQRCEADCSSSLRKVLHESRFDPVRQSLGRHHSLASGSSHRIRSLLVCSARAADLKPSSIFSTRSLRTNETCPSRKLRARTHTAR